MTTFRDTFDDVIWSDETSVQLEAHRCFCYRKEGMKPKPKPRPKHSIEVHVWAGISVKGPTNVCIFEGKRMHHCFAKFFKQHYYLTFKKSFLLPVLTDLCKITILNTALVMLSAFMKGMGLTGGETPPESPDLNPIENVWHELKEYLRQEIKPTNKSELIDGIS